MATGIFTANAKRAAAKKAALQKPAGEKTTTTTTTACWRVATRADRRAIIALSLQLFSEDPGTFVLTARDIGRTLSTLEREPVRGCAVVAEDEVDGVVGVVGYALLCTFFSNELRGEVCTVDELYVVDAVRGRGVGSLLVRQLVEQRHFFPAAVAFELEVTPRNTRARALYERLGFVPRKNASLRLLRR